MRPMPDFISENKNCSSKETDCNFSTSTEIIPVCRIHNGTDELSAEKCVTGRGTRCELTWTTFPGGVTFRHIAATARGP